MSTDLTDPLTDRLNTVDWSIAADPSALRGIAASASRRRRVRAGSWTAAGIAVAVTAAGLVGLSQHQPADPYSSAAGVAVDTVPAAIVIGLRQDAIELTRPAVEPRISGAAAQRAVASHLTGSHGIAGEWLATATDLGWQRRTRGGGSTLRVDHRLVWLIVTTPRPSAGLPGDPPSGMPQSRHVQPSSVSSVALVDASSGRWLLTTTIPGYHARSWLPVVSQTARASLNAYVRATLRRQGWTVSRADARVGLSGRAAIALVCPPGPCAGTQADLVWVSGTTTGALPGRFLAWLVIGPQEPVTPQASGSGLQPPQEQRVSVIAARTGEVLAVRLLVPDSSTMSDLPCTRESC